MKTYIFKKSKKLLGGTFAFLLLASLVMLNFKQANPAPEKFRVNYKEKIIKFSRIDAADTSKLSLFEKDALRKIEEVRMVEKVVDNNNNLTITSTILSTNEYEPWMKRPTKIVTTRNGTVVYDQAGVPMSNMPANINAQTEFGQIEAQFSSLGYKLAPEFTPISDAQLLNMQNEGAQAVRLPNGTIKTVKENVEQLYNYAEKSYQTTTTENGKKVSQLFRDYDDINGKTLPVTRIEKQYKQLKSGACIENVTITKYSNYSFPVQH